MEQNNIFKVTWSFYIPGERIEIVSVEDRDKVVYSIYNREYIPIYAKQEGIEYKPDFLQEITEEKFFIDGDIIIVHPNLLYPNRLGFIFDKLKETGIFNFEYIDESGLKNQSSDTLQISRLAALR